MTRLLVAVLGVAAVTLVGLLYRHDGPLPWSVAPGDHVAAPAAAGAAVDGTAAPVATPPAAPVLRRPLAPVPPAPPEPPVRAAPGLELTPVRAGGRFIGYGVVQGSGDPRLRAGEVIVAVDGEPVEDSAAGSELLVAALRDPDAVVATVADAGAWLGAP